MFPFLPLPSNFDPLDGEAWQTLLQNIQMCLVQSQDSEGTANQILMCEFFWMSFVAAFPTFPFGDWPNWDPRIPFQGDFISDWMADFNLPYTIMYRGDLLQGICQYIWQKLTVAVGHFFSASIISYSCP